VPYITFTCSLPRTHAHTRTHTHTNYSVHILKTTIFRKCWTNSPNLPHPHLFGAHHQVGLQQVCAIKEPYIPSKEPYIPSKKMSLQIYILASPIIWSTYNRCVRLKSPIFRPKSHIFRQKSPDFRQNSPRFRQKRRIFRTTSLCRPSSSGSTVGVCDEAAL